MTSSSLVKLFGLQAVNYFVNCLALWYGSKLVATSGVKSEGGSREPLRP